MMPDRQSLPHAVVFDLDGTLVDSAPDLHVCANQLLAELDLPALSLAQVTGFIGEGIPPLIERCLAAAGCPASGATLDAAITRYKAIYAATPAGLTRPYPGVLDCLAQLQRREVRLGVCTNKSEPLAREVLDALDMTGFFQAIVGGDTLPVRKPDPAPLHHVARLLSGATGNLVYVGDSEVDAATAVAARVPFVLFTRGYRKVPADSLPHAVKFDDFGALTGLLTGLACKP